jgi:hypothetical protein
MQVGRVSKLIHKSLLLLPYPSITLHISFYPSIYYCQAGTRFSYMYYCPFLALLCSPCQALNGWLPIIYLRHFPTDKFMCVRQNKYYKFKDGIRRWITFLNFFKRIFRIDLLELYVEIVQFLKSTLYMFL